MIPLSYNKNQEKMNIIKKKNNTETKVIKIATNKEQKKKYCNWSNLNIKIKKEMTTKNAGILLNVNFCYTCLLCIFFFICFKPCPISLWFSKPKKKASNEMLEYSVCMYEYGGIYVCVIVVTYNKYLSKHFLRSFLMTNKF